MSALGVHRHRGDSRAGDKQRVHYAIERVAADAAEAVNGGDRIFATATQWGDLRVGTTVVDATECGDITVSIVAGYPPREPVTATLHLEPNAVDAEGCPTSFVPMLAIDD